MWRLWWNLPQNRLQLIIFRARLRENFGRIPSRRQTIKYLNKDLKYSFKKGSSRSVLSKNLQLEYIQTIFAWRILEFISKGDYIINVDEASFSKSVQQKYSWIPRGKGSAIINQNWQGSAIVIFGLWIDGNWMCCVYSKTTTARRFSQFLMILQKFWTIVIGIDPQTLKVTLDNAAIHLAQKTKRVAALLDLQIYSLPQYSPSLAPTEWVFGIMKKKISHRRPKTIINFSKNYGKNIIYDSLLDLEQEEGSRIWKYFIYQARDVIYKCRDQLSIERLLNNQDDVMGE